MPDFSPQPHYCASALRRIAASIPEHGEGLLAHLDEFTELACSGQPRFLPPFFAKLLPEDEWRWPWLEEWRARFDSLGLQPNVWRQKYSPKSVSIEIHLLANVAMRWIHDARHWDDMCRLLGYWGWRPGQSFPERASIFTGWRLSVVQGVDPEEVLQAEFRRFLNGDHDHRPPYFPGDGSIILLNTRRS